MLVRKKNGTLQEFDIEKIAEAAKKSFLNVAYTEEDAESESWKVATDVEHMLNERSEVHREEIHDLVQLSLMNFNKHAAVAYIRYRYNQRNKNGHVDNLISSVRQISIETSKDNANIHNGPASKLYEIGSAMNVHYTMNHVIPKDLARAHAEGDLHIHDMNYYSLTYNCLSYDLQALLTKGFNMPHGFIRSPKSINAAAALTAVTLQSVQNSQLGGVAVNDVDTALAPFVGDATDKEVDQAMESLLYNLNSLHSRAANQIPFSSISIGADLDPNAKRIASSILRVYKLGLGKGEPFLFPNIAFKVATGINLEPGTPNHELLLQSLGVSSTRMNPTYCFVSSSFNAPYGTNASAMGCRSRIQANIHGDQVTDRRGNIAFTTLNLPRIAIESKSTPDFFKRLDKMLVLAEKSLMHRWNTLRNLRVSDIPFVMGEGLYMGSENLKPTDTVEEALKHGTLTIGFIGLAQVLIKLTGKHHGESNESQALGLQIVQHMRNFTDSMIAKHNLNWSVIGSPAEGLSDRFTKLDKKKYGIVAGVTDREHYSNSSHIPVEFSTTIEHKIDIEAPYHTLENGGHIFYAELDGPPANNIEGLYSIIKYMAASDIGYAGINYPQWGLVTAM